MELETLKMVLWGSVCFICGFLTKEPFDTVVEFIHAIWKDGKDVR